MIGDFLLKWMAELEAALIEQFQQILTDMDNFKVDHEFGIFVFKGMVAVGGRDQYFFDPMVDKGLDIFPGQGREHLFTAELADTFAAFTEVSR